MEQCACRNGAAPVPRSGRTHNEPGLSPLVLVVHGWSDRNKGDAAIVECLARLVRGSFPEAEFKLVSDFGAHDRRLTDEYFETRAHFPGGILGSLFPIVPIEPSRRQGVAASGRLSEVLQTLFYVFRAAWVLSPVPAPACLWTRPERETLRAFRRAAVVISKGGGFIFAEPTLRSSFRLRRNLFPLSLASRFGVPFVLYGQSIGPFATRRQAALARRVLDGARLILVRESLSARTLAELGVAAPVRVVPDLAFGLGSAPPTKAEAVLRRHRVPLGAPLLGVTVREWGEATPRYVSAMADAVASLAREAGVHAIVWPQCTGPGPLEDDRRTGRALRRVLEERGQEGVKVTVVEEELPAAVLKACYGRMDAFVATRFHSAIFALSGGVPTLVVGYWGPKAEGIMGSLGLEEWVLPMTGVTPEGLTSALLGLWEHRREVGRLIGERLPAVVDEAKRLDPAVLPTSPARINEGEQ
ncbi:MAG: polysaccharide pyruvyl transferase family protein [Bacillota bacterium]|nr:MAG: polysaccharide pyruvyl transferase family protein [Bacillota bacterium]